MSNFNSMTILDSTCNDNHLVLTNQSGFLTSDKEIAQEDYSVRNPLKGTSPYLITINSDFYLTVTQGEVNQLLDVTTNYTMKITPLG